MSLRIMQAGRGLSGDYSLTAQVPLASLAINQQGTCL